MISDKTRTFLASEQRKWLGAMWDAWSADKPAAADHEQAVYDELSATLDTFKHNEPLAKELWIAIVLERPEYLPWQQEVFRHFREIAVSKFGGHVEVVNGEETLVIEVAKLTK